MKTVLITGTDTGVGKTWVGCALARALAAGGLRVIAIKPVETGCVESVGGAEDGAQLAEATGQAEPRAALHRFARAVAPAVAAEIEGIEPVDLDAMLLRIEALSAGGDVVLLEGAGGLLSPITWEWNVVELARSLGAGALVVGPDRLGVINHALLTLGSLELAGVEVAGLVLTPPRTPDESTGTNAGAIARISGLERVATIPRVEDRYEAVASMGVVVGWMGRPAAEVL
jgi:dethiobiotin synthase